MTEIESIKFKMWAIQQSILQREDIIDRSRDENHKNLVRKNIEADKAELALLREELKRKEKEI